MTNKDKVTQPSSALRIAAELTDLIVTHFGADGHISANVVSDGGPDHRVTFESVKVSSLTFNCFLPACLKENLGIFIHLHLMHQ